MATCCQGEITRPRGDLSSMIQPLYKWSSSIIILNPTECDTLRRQLWTQRSIKQYMGLALPNTFTMVIAKQHIFSHPNYRFWLKENSTCQEWESGARIQTADPSVIRMSHSTNMATTGPQPPYTVVWKAKGMILNPLKRLFIQKPFGH